MNTLGTSKFSEQPLRKRNEKDNEKKTISGHTELLCESLQMLIIRTKINNGWSSGMIFSCCRVILCIADGWS